MTERTTTDDAPDAGMIRSEERLRVDTRSTVIGRAVLRKRIVTEQRTVTVEVRREVVDLEVVPVDGDGPVEDEQAHAAHLALPEVVLHEEQLVLTRRIVPVERVRLEVHRVSGQQQVTETLRHEEITTSGDVAPA